MEDGRVVDSLGFLNRHASGLVSCVDLLKSSRCSPVRLRVGVQIHAVNAGHHRHEGHAGSDCTCRVQEAL